MTSQSETKNMDLKRENTQVTKTFIVDPQNTSEDDKNASPEVETIRNILGK